MADWLKFLDLVFPIRFLSLLGLTALALAGGVGALVMEWGPAWGWAGLLGLAGLGLGLRDMLQRRHAVLRNYPVIGHLRFLLEFIRPEMRQYFIESDNEASPFSRQQRSLVYQRAKGDPDKRPFGTNSTSMPKAMSGSTTRWHRPG